MYYCNEIDEKRNEKTFFWDLNLGPLMQQATMVPILIQIYIFKSFFFYTTIELILLLLIENLNINIL